MYARPRRYQLCASVGSKHVIEHVQDSELKTDARRGEKSLTSLETLRQILNGEILVLERRAILMVQPSKLLEYFGMRRVVLHDTFIRFASTIVLPMTHAISDNNRWPTITTDTYIMLLLIYMTDLEPNVRMCKWVRWIAKDAVEAL